MERLKSLIKWVVLLLSIYLILFTWNSKTGQLERFANVIGLEFVGTVLYPGKWIQLKTKELWEDYIDLRRVREENKRLRQKLEKLRIKEITLKVKVQEWERLRKLLKFRPLKGWNFFGARVLYYRLGPANILNSFVVDMGSRQGVQKDLPVLTPDGLVGRILKTSLDFSTVLLISDSNSRIPVISKKHRTKGILQGIDSPSEMKVIYVPITSPLDEGEEFVTSGLGGIFPKGIPVAKTIKIENNLASLFKKVIVAPMTDLTHVEEVLILKREDLRSIVKTEKR
jgi:rod shape-determining protein MreC